MRRNVVVVVLVAMYLSGCSRPRIENFAIATYKIDEKQAQSKAMIRLSDPQVFSREALINDRIREKQHLESLLTTSTGTKLDFEPQVARELSAVSAISGQLGISANPAAGLKFRAEVEDFNRASEIRRLSQEIETTKLLGELARSQQALKELQENKGQGPGAPVNTAGAPTPPTFQPQSLETAIGSLVEGVNKRADALSKSLETKAQTSSLKATPEDYYEDLSAYRSRLRTDLAAASLDDAHDLSGNTLYRFQFRATVLPGENKNKWGVLRATTIAPVMKEDDIRRLYFTWLAHSTRRLNLIDHKGDVESIAQYARLGASGGLYDIADITLKGKKLFLATMKGSRDIFETFAENFWTWDDFEKNRKTYEAMPGEALNDLGTKKLNDIQQLLILTRFLERVAPNKALPEAFMETLLKDDKGRSDKEKYIAKTYATAVVSATEILRMVPTVEAVVAGLGDLGQLPKEIRPAALQLLDGYDLAFELSDKYLQYISELRKTLQKAVDKSANGASLSTDERFHLERKKSLIKYFEKIQTRETIVTDQARKIPEKFCSAILVKGQATSRPVCPKRGWKADGESFSYSAMPVQQTQRLSSVAGVANSAQMALALSAAIPNSGISAEAGLATLRNSIGKVQALERVPLVVGFADNSKSATDQAHFGWVFGPRVGLDPKQGQLELTHTASNFQVTADLSIPSWWPRLELKTETAWIKNWYDPTELDYVDKNHSLAKAEINRQLPLSQGSLDAITDRLVVDIFKQRLRSAQIYSVTPDKVSYCAEGPIELLAHGANLWRSPEVFLRGKKHEDIRVLPDMAGIAAKFTIKNLPKHGTPDELVVVTQVGTSKAPITIDESCDKPKPSAPSIKVVGNRFILGHKLTLEVEPEKIPGVNFGMKLGIRPAEVGNSFPWEKGSGFVTSISADSKRITGMPVLGNLTDAPWNQPSKDGKTTFGSSGTLLDAALLMNLKPGFVPTEYKAENQVIFYVSQSDANAKLKIGSTSTTQQAPRGATPPLTEIPDLHRVMTIELPPAYWVAYPKLGDAQTRLRGTIKGHDIILEVISGDFPKDRSREYKFRVGLPDKYKKHYDELHKQKDLTVELQFVGQEPNVPKIDGEIKIKKASTR